jgi:hypothetical protein
MTRIRVDLPAPDGPAMDTNPPAGTEKEISLSAGASFASSSAKMRADAREDERHF